MLEKSFPSDVMAHEKMRDRFEVEARAVVFMQLHHLFDRLDHPSLLYVSLGKGPLLVYLPRPHLDLSREQVALQNQRTMAHISVGKTA